MEIMGILGSIAAKDPKEDSMVLQTYNMWKSHEQEFNAISAQYQAAAHNATGFLDVSGIVIQLLKLHPVVHDLIIQTVKIWQDDLPGLVRLVDDVQSAAANS